MALLDDLFKGNVVTALAVGVGGALLAPLVAPAVTNVLRPAAKAVIKGGILAYDKGREAAAQLGETTSDIAAEARADLAQGDAASPAAKAAG